MASLNVDLNDYANVARILNIDFIQLKSCILNSSCCCVTGKLLLL